MGVGFPGWGRRAVGLCVLGVLGLGAYIRVRGREVKSFTVSGWSDGDADREWHNGGFTEYTEDDDALLGGL